MKFKPTKKRSKDKKYLKGDIWHEYIGDPYNWDIICANCGKSDGEHMTDDSCPKTKKK